jgi:hypothetical protein
MQVYIYKLLYFFAFMAEGHCIQIQLTNATGKIDLRHNINRNSTNFTSHSESETPAASIPVLHTYLNVHWNENLILL